MLPNTPIRTRRNNNRTGQLNWTDSVISGASDVNDEDSGKSDDNDDNDEEDEGEEVEEGKKLLPSPTATGDPVVPFVVVVLAAVDAAVSGDRVLCCV